MKVSRLWKSAAAWSGAGRQSPHKRRVLLVNLDFRDVVYSHLWGRAVLDGCAQRDLAVDVVGVNPFAGRDLAAELGMARSALDVRVDGAVVYLDQPDEARCRSVIGELLERHRYQQLILNCDASLFVHLMLERERELADAVWTVYDRHFHIDLKAHEQDERLRDRVVASQVFLYAIHEIASAGVMFDVEAEIVANQDTIVGQFKRLGIAPERIRFQHWPLDDAFFAPVHSAAVSTDAFVIFSGGDSGRDYATLFEATRELPVQLRLCAGRYPTPLPSNVTILPRLPLHQFRDEVGRATVVVVPVTGEPRVSGITVIAMAKMMGIPVIASDNPAVRMQIRSQGDGGYLTQTGNAALLRSLLTGLIESPAERERLGREGRVQAARDLSLTEFVNRMFEGR